MRTLSKEHRENISKALTGKKRSKEARQILSQSLKGRVFTKDHKDKISKALTGRKLSKIAKEKLRIYRYSCTGSNASNWKGGITPVARTIRHSFKYRQWRSDVFTKDDFTCQKCFQRGGDLEAHHIKKFSIIMNENNIKSLDEAMECRELWNINNGLTFCKKCHGKKHRKM